MENSAYCVIDVGTGGVKCLVFDDAGFLVFRESSTIDFQMDGHAISFQPAAVWAEVCRMTRLAVKECEKRQKKIVTVSSTSMREGNVFYDKEGKELLAVPNLDARAYKEAEAIQDSLGETVYSLSGHWPSSIFLASRLKYLQKSKETLFRKITKVSMINDWVLFKFSGEFATEPTNGCETALFDLKKRNWSEELIQESHFENSLFPDVKECGSVLGQVRKDASLESGFEESAQVVVGAADTESAVAGCGVLDHGDVVAVAGTTTPVQAVVDRPILDPERRTWTCCHVRPDRWTVESNAGATGLVFKWWAKMTGLDYSELDAEVKKDSPSPAKVKVNIGASVMNARHPHAIVGGIRGVSSWTPRSEVTLGILEAGCFSVRANLEQLEAVLGKRFGRVYFCGGDSESELWRTMQAGILGRSLISFREGEATGRGAAMLSAVAAGTFPSLREASRSLLKEGIVTNPNGETFAMYATFYQEWLGRTDK
jgi:sugar (pentulose or hexulose) kinase